MILRVPDGSLRRDREPVRTTVERGTATAEVAILLPVAMVLLLGAIDFGRALYELIAVANAATVGVKYGAHDAARSGDIEGMKQAARNDLAQAVPVEEVTVDAERYCVCEDGGEIDCISGVCAGGPAKKRTYVRVRVDKPFSTLFPYPGVPSAVLLSREARMRVQ